MHLVFERSTGEFKTNCNILALTWMPYYIESKFRSALLDYHQKQLFEFDSTNNGILSAPARTDANANASNRQPHGLLAATAPRNSHQARANGLESIDGSPLGQTSTQNESTKMRFTSSRAAELYRRHVCAKDYHPAGLLRPTNVNSFTEADNSAVDLSDKYGLLPDFGWLVLGNVGKIVGVTLTSLVEPPAQSSVREPNQSNKQLVHDSLARDSSSKEDDLMQFDDMLNVISSASNEAAESTNDFSSFRPDNASVRNNYNLRGHMDEVILVKWNELYQKLATVDSKGNVLIWCKVNEKFTMQTPFYNRTKSVADFKWSNDGKTALICYTDSFILVGSSSGQRHWHSMLNLDDYHITCASWTPNDEQLLLGVSNGNVVVIDLPRSELTELVVNQINIRTMCWSSCEMSMSSLKKSFDSLTPKSRRNSSTSSSNNRRNSSSNTVVNHRRLSRDCSVFSRYRFRSQGLASVSSNNTANATTARQPPLNNNLPAPSSHRAGQSLLSNIDVVSSSSSSSSADDDCIESSDTLAVDFANNTIKLYDGGLNDPEPKTILVDLESYTMNWSSDGLILAVAGFNIHTSAPSVGRLHCRYLNSIMFYNQQGKLIYQYTMNYTRYPITAFTWAHNDHRLFVATGPRLHCARVYFGIPPLSLLASSRIQRHMNLPCKSEILDALLVGPKSNIVNLAHTWQTYNCPIKLNHCSKKSAKEYLETANTSSLLSVGCDDDLNNQKGDDITAANANMCNNSLVYLFQLPLKLKYQIDQLFGPTIRQPYNKHWSLNDIIWHVPKGERRYYCTLVCYTSDRDIASAGHQYKTNPMDQFSEDYYHQATDQAKIFVLYVEFLGALVPILRARRVGFLKPEFVIFDPEDNQIRSQQLRKVSDISQQSQYLDSNYSMQRKFLDNQQVDLAMTPLGLTAQYYNEINNEMNYSDVNYCPVTGEEYSIGRQSVSDAEHYYNFDGDSIKIADEPKLQLQQSDNLHYQQKLRITEYIANRSHHQEPLALPKMNNLYLANMMSAMRENPQVNHMKQSFMQESRRNRIDNHKLRVASGKSKSRLTENNELVRIKSNIWGTKFKLISVGKHMIGRKTILGSVTYKASILHLQPRQIFLTIKDMSNYCCLCSIHHHKSITRGPPPIGKSSLYRRDQHKESYKNRHETSAAAAALITPIRINTRRLNGNLGNRRNEDKVLLPVGDAIRIAPKLDSNQKYQFISDNQRSSTSYQQPPSSNLRMRRHPTRLKYGPQQDFSTSSETHAAFERTFSGRKSTSSSRSKDQSRSFANLDGNEDDVLTLSLGQGDQVRVEMSSLSNLNQTQEMQQPTASTSINQSNAAMDDFLSTNKTLKSIQTITKMIVDLSSKANELDGAELSSDQPSPTKLIKLSPAKGSPTSSSSNKAASRYVAPDTPVHRPRRVAARLAGSGIYVDRSQSANTTPLKSFDESLSRQRRRRHNNQNHRNTGSDATPDQGPSQALPPPPPSVPLSKRFSSSAKRFFSGSLRSLQSSSIGGLNAPDLGFDDNEPLVDTTRRTMHQELRHRLLGQASQSSSPVTSRRLRDADKRELEPSLFRGKKLAEKIVGTTPLAGNSSSRADRSSHKQRAGSSLNLNGSVGLEHDISAPSSSCSASSEDDCDCGSSDLELDYDSANRRAKKKDGKLFASLRDLKQLGFRSTDNDQSTIEQQRQKQQRPRRKNKYPVGSSGEQRRTRRKSLCPNPGCCCAREFKLSNRPPVWNKLNQVYQLDFGGRVTQESAKNLQIDHNGELALQFGRIDKFTYTLDYKYPFNAVQAMAIALASLTQRLK